MNHNHDFQHEHASIGLFDLLMKENNLFPKFYEAGLTDEDIHFIKEIILGDPSEAPQGFPWKGRGEKTFLYDIVANKRNGIDVDKFDYFARDCWMLGVTKSFDSTRLMKFARVFPIRRTGSTATPAEGGHSGESNLEVCFNVKEAWNIFEVRDLNSLRPIIFYFVLFLSYSTLVILFTNVHINIESPMRSN
jgi:hypothetical protein